MLAAGTRTQVWDYDNRLSSVTTSGSTTSMVYDYTGMRTEKSGPLGTTIFPFSGYEIGPGGITVKYIRIGIENVASKKSTGETLFYHNDHLGGVNVITNISGLLAQLIEYDPWGKISRSEGAGDSLRRFTGKILDTESGLYYYGGRYYDPELGRFISPDPFVPQPDDPQSLNRYSYVINNPVNYVDPDGYFFKKLFKKIGRFFKKAAKFLWENVIRPAIRPLITIVTFAVLAPVLAPYLGPVLAGVAAGWVAGVAGVGADLLVNPDAYRGTKLGGEFAIGGLIGGVTGGITGGISGEFLKFPIVASNVFTKTLTTFSVFLQPLTRGHAARDAAFGFLGGIATGQLIDIIFGSLGLPNPSPFSPQAQASGPSGSFGASQVLGPIRFGTALIGGPAGIDVRMLPIAVPRDAQSINSVRPTRRDPIEGNRSFNVYDPRGFWMEKSEVR